MNENERSQEWSNILLVSDYIDNDNRVEIDGPDSTQVSWTRGKRRKKNTTRYSSAMRLEG